MLDIFKEQPRLRGGGIALRRTCLDARVEMSFLLMNSLCDGPERGGLQSNVVHV